MAISEDEVVEAGLRALLRTDSSLFVLPSSQLDRATVAVVGVSALDDASLQMIGGFERDGGPRVLCVAEQADAESLAQARRAGAHGILMRSSVSGPTLIDAVKRIARGRAVVPEELLDELLLRASGVGPSDCALAPREIAVLRLLAEGESTAEIGHSLAYSERTVKGIVHGITSRLGVKNRSHAVAHALRNGLI